MLRSLLVHRTNRVVDVYHVGLGLTYYVLMLSLLFYVVYVQIYLGGGYQFCEEAVGTVTAKVKGSTVGPNGHVWDSPLLVKPGTEPNALFISTAIHLTVAQVEGDCVGVSVNSKCTVGEEDNACIIGTELDNGRVTKKGCYSAQGKKLTKIGDTGHCMLRAWCPLESSSNNDELAINDLEGVENFRVLVRAGAKFPSNGAQVNNLNGSRVTPGFNQFTVKDILNRTSRAILSSDDEDSKDSSEVEVKSDSPITLKEIAMTGCVILFSVHWNCDLDSVSSCVPEYAFQRLDRPDSFWPGFEYKYTNLRNEIVDKKALTDGADDVAEAKKIMVRDLYSVKGIRILFQTTGVGCQFHFQTLSVNIGAGLAILAVASIITDMILMYLPWPGEMSVRNQDGKWINVPAKDALYGIKVQNAKLEKNRVRYFLRGEEQHAGEDEPLIDKNC